MHYEIYGISSERVEDKDYYKITIGGRFWYKGCPPTYNEIKICTNHGHIFGILKAYALWVLQAHRMECR